MMRLHDNDRIRARVCEKHVGDEAVGLMLVQLLAILVGTLALIGVGILALLALALLLTRRG